MVHDDHGINVIVVGFMGIDGNVIQYLMVARSEMDKTAPAASAVIGGEQNSSTGSKEDMVGIVRIVCQASDIAPIWPQNGPLTSPRN